MLLGLGLIANMVHSIFYAILQVGILISHASTDFFLSGYKERAERYLGIFDSCIEQKRSLNK